MLHINSCYENFPFYLFLFLLIIYKSVYLLYDKKICIYSIVGNPETYVRASLSPCFTQLILFSVLGSGLCGILFYIHVNKIE